MLAYAVQDLFPEAKPTIGPAIENGFYYDFDRAEPFTPDDLERLEARMNEIVAADYPMTGREVTRDEAIDAFTGNPYKVEIAREIPEGEPITLYTIGDFTDLCRGGHADSTGEIGAFKLTSVAGAYWRGDEHNPMLQRIYGTAWYDARELDAHLRSSKKRSERDHRKLGAELDLFSIEEEAGGGLVFWHPKGAIVRGIIEDFIREGLRERGYQPVVTPHVVSERLYEISGHLENFGAEHVRPARGRGSALSAQADELPGTHSHLQEPPAQLSRLAVALLRIRHRLPLRALRRAARAHARARLHAGRRASVLHARAAAGRVRTDARRSAPR